MTLGMELAITVQPAGRTTALRGRPKARSHTSSSPFSRYRPGSVYVSDIRSRTDSPGRTAGNRNTTTSVCALIVSGSPEDEVRRLKAEPGKAISVQGSASIVQALARADLVDEYRLYVHPVVLGAGTLLFGPGTGRQDFTLTASKTYANGVVALTHRRARTGG